MIKMLLCVVACSFLLLSCGGGTDGGSSSSGGDPAPATIKTTLKWGSGTWDNVVWG